MNQIKGNLKLKIITDHSIMCKSKDGMEGDKRQKWKKKKGSEYKKRMCNKKFQTHYRRPTTSSSPCGEWLATVCMCGLPAGTTLIFSCAIPTPAVVLPFSPSTSTASSPRISSKSSSVSIASSSSPCPSSIITGIFGSKFGVACAGTNLGVRCEME